METFSAAALQKTVPAHIDRTQKLPAITIIIDADVAAENLSNLGEITLAIDEEKVDALARYLIPESSDVDVEYGEINERIWRKSAGNEITAELCQYTDGLTSYLDILHDQSPPFLDVEHIHEYGYITSTRFDDMEETASEAAAVSADFLQNYSCFTYQTEYVLSAGQDTENGITGYYDISLQAVYDKVPVSVKYDADSIGSSVHLAYSSDGIITIYGVFLLNETARRAIEQIVSLDSAIERLESDLPAFTEENQVSINRISVEYFMQFNSADSTYSLIPVWSFAGAGSSDDSVPFQIMYSAEDGSFWGFYY